MASCHLAAHSPGLTISWWGVISAVVHKALLALPLIAHTPGIYLCNQVRLPLPRMLTCYRTKWRLCVREIPIAFLTITDLSSSELNNWRVRVF